MDICWQVLVEDNMCANPLAGHRTTYTECCCLYGVAWSEQCAFCPRKDSGNTEENASWGYFTALILMPWAAAIVVLLGDLILSGVCLPQEVELVDM